MPNILDQYTKGLHELNLPSMVLIVPSLKPAGVDALLDLVRRPIQTFSAQEEKFEELLGDLWDYQYNGNFDYSEPNVVIFVGDLFPAYIMGYADVVVSLSPEGEFIVQKKPNDFPVLSNMTSAEIYNFFKQTFQYTEFGDK